MFISVKKVSCLISVSSIKRWAQSRLVYLPSGTPTSRLFTVPFTKGMSRLNSDSFIKLELVYEHVVFTNIGDCLRKYVFSGRPCCVVT